MQARCKIQAMVPEVPGGLVQAEVPQDLAQTRPMLSRFGVDQV